MLSLILPIVGPLIKWAVHWFVAKNTAQMVAAAEAQNLATDTDEIRVLIHNAHFGATQGDRDAAMDELRRRGAIT